MKRWIFAACLLPLMMTSCDIFSGSDDDDMIIVEPPQESFIYDTQAIAGDTLMLTTFTRLVEPKIFFNDILMETIVVDNLPVDNDNLTNDSISNPVDIGQAYFIYVKIPDTYNGSYELRVEAARADSPQSGVLKLLLGFVEVYTMQDDDLADLYVGQPVWTDLTDALALLETVEFLPEGDLYRGVKYTTNYTLDSLVCFDAAQQPLPSARLSAFKTVSNRYVVANLFYIMCVDTVYAASEGYIAYRVPSVVNQSVLILSETGFILPLDDIYGQGETSSNLSREFQFRCESDDCFYVMLEAEEGSAVSNKPIYRVDIDQESLASFSLPMDAYEYSWRALHAIDVEQVHDGSVGAANSESFSWQIYDGLVVLNESTLLDGRAICDIQPNSGTSSSSFVGRPAVFVSPRGALCTLRYTSRGNIQSEQLSTSGGSFRWITHHQYFDFGGSNSNVVVTRTTDNVYLSGVGRYYYWAPDGEILYADCEEHDERFIVAKNYYPYADYYLYSNASDGLYRTRLDARSERSLVLPAIEGEVYRVMMFGERALAVTTQNDIYLIDGDRTEHIEEESSMFTDKVALVR